MGIKLKIAMALAAVLWAALSASGQIRRKIIIDEDAMGPGGTDLNAILLLIQSRETDPLGITVVTGDGWRDEEVAHALRLLEIIGRTDIHVYPGATFPLVRDREGTLRWEKLYGKVAYMGAWFSPAPGWHYHGPFVVPPLEEGNPVTKPSSEDAAHFMIRMVQRYPHQVTIFAGGPLTDVALAMALDPKFAELSKELVVMGGSLNPQTRDEEFRLNPQREFNFWFDPEAAHKVLTGDWPKITDTPVDISVKTRETAAMVKEIGEAHTPAAQYVSKYAQPGGFMWDELAADAWLDPKIITRKETLYLDVNIDHGADYGNTLAWRPGANPGLGERLVNVEMDLDRRRFDRDFIRLMTRPTPKPRHH